MYFGSGVELTKTKLSKKSGSRLLEKFDIVGMTFLIEDEKIMISWRLAFAQKANTAPRNSLTNPNP